MYYVDVFLILIVVFILLAIYLNQINSEALVLPVIGIIVSTVIFLFGSIIDDSPRHKIKYEPIKTEIIKSKTKVYVELEDGDTEEFTEHSSYVEINDSTKFYEITYRNWWGVLCSDGITYKNK